MSDAGGASANTGPDASVLTTVDPERLTQVLSDALDETSLLSPHGLRSLSKRHEEHPFEVTIEGETYSVGYEPAESRTWMYGGNSNWRGPVWFPINHLVIESLERYHMYLGPEFTVECPTGSGRMLTLQQVADELRHRLIALFLPGPDGRRPAPPAFAGPGLAGLVGLRRVQRVLRRRQRCGAGRRAPDRLDRFGRGPDHRPARLTDF